MDNHLISYYIGIFIIFLSHAYILYKPDKFLMNMTLQTHSYVNIFAGVLIAYYFMHKEGYIDF